MEEKSREALSLKIAQLEAELEKQAAELAALKQKQYIYETVLNKIPVDIFVKNPADGFRYVYCNESFVKTQGSCRDVIGKDDYEVFADPQDAAYLRNDDVKVLSDNKQYVYQESYTNQEGKSSIILVFKEPLQLDGYPLPLLLGASLDLACVPHISQLLLEKFAEIDKETKTQTVKMANLRHEIKTPLTAIVGFTNLLNDNQMQLSEEDRDNFLRLVNSNTQLLQSIVNEILNKPQATNHEPTMRKKKIDLDSLLRDVHAIYAPRFNDTAVAFLYQKGADTPTLFGDEAKLLQVIYNLLNNSIKYTSKGSITIGYDTSEDQRQVKIYVRDTGTGIAQENLGKVFNRFEKLGSTVEGYGLGLSIVKSIVDAEGGHCGVESKLGEGSCFWFELPTA